MRCVIVAAVLMALAVPAHAQLSAPNAAGITYGHVHLNVADIEVVRISFVEANAKWIAEAIGVNFVAPTVGVSDERIRGGNSEAGCGGSKQAG